MQDLAAFQGIHRDEIIVVCGCGESLNDFEHPERFVTIGVNDVGRRFDPTYLVVVNPRSQFSGDRFRYVEQSRAKYLFTQLDLRLPPDRVVRFRLGRYGGTTFSDPRVLHYTRNSPYVALCLAAHMGARRIGLIGIDFTDRHFFGGSGPHPLAPYFEHIDSEYRRLAESLAAIGIEVVNLSRVSRLTAFPKVPELLQPPVAAAEPVSVGDKRRPKIFGVNYRFLACGDVFTQGLRHAAAALNVEWCDADWDDRNLPALIAAFGPDLIFVVHGRRFAQRWKGEVAGGRTAVWLLDEPYEVDDTSSFSRAFDHVFVNDPATLDRHRHAHYLPACHDPVIHHPGGAERPHDVGFVGGGSPGRERRLAALAAQGLLSYVVGGPWRDPALKRLSLSRNIPASGAAELYRATKIVVNVFRDRHHFNKAGVVATSMNPRVYEALACGAMVVSEPRPEIERRVPELPIFHDADELVSLVTHFLAQPHELESTRAACMRRLQMHSYAERLRTVIATTLGAGALDAASPEDQPPEPATCPTRINPLRIEPPRLGDWEICGPVACCEDGWEVELRSQLRAAPGSERGLVSIRPHRDVTLSFEALLPGDACFVAKIGQTAQRDQCTNSYHLYCDAGNAYLARHYCIFKTFELPRDTWIAITLAHRQGVLSIDESGRPVHQVQDRLLSEGFAVLAVKRGTVRLRNIRLVETAGEKAATAPAEGLRPGDPSGPRPQVSVVTTVYDRVDSLAHCIRSVRRQRFQDYEHIVVADCPPQDVAGRIERLVGSFSDNRLSFFNLAHRHNNWGIAPAATGLRRARGQYICFLSDDNGYTPEHLALLAGVLDEEPDLGFAYSSCRYAGRLVLRHPVPAPARIDLGQPMFRRDLFTTYFSDDLPFQMMAWDWAMIDSFVRQGVRFRHVDVPSFIFRLARYPHLMVKA